MRVDLHLHSTVSDGIWTPAAVAAEAARRRLECWALTDHDCLDGYREIAGAAGLIAGVEISCWSEGREVHVVALGVDPADAGLEAQLSAIRAAREERARVIVDRVAGRTGRRIDLDALRPAAARSLTRSHLADVLVASDVAENRWDAFRDHIGDASIGDLPPPAFPRVADAAAAVHHAGGVALLAHPGHYRDIHLVERLLAQGLDGMELRHPRCPVELRRPFGTLAASRRLLVSCGSDFHHPPCRIGDWRLPRARLRPLLERIGAALPAG